MKVSSFLSPFLLLMGRSSLGGVSAASTAVGTIRGLLQEEEGSVSESDVRRHLGSSISTASTSTSAAHGTIRNLLHLQEEEESENESDHLVSSVSTASATVTQRTIRKLEEEEDGTWETITRDRFETKWGNFETHKDSQDAIRLVDERENDYIPQGKACLMIRGGNNDDKSSVYHRKGYDVRDYDKFRLTFSFSMEKLENIMGHFVVEISTDGGESYGDNYLFRPNGDYGLNQVYHATVDTHLDLFLTTNEKKKEVKIRFRCSGDGDNERVYIDDVHFEGFKGNNRMIRGLQGNVTNIFNHTTIGPTDLATNASVAPSVAPTGASNVAPSVTSSVSTTPSAVPSLASSAVPSGIASAVPSLVPSVTPSDSMVPSGVPSGAPSAAPSTIPSGAPSDIPSLAPSAAPTNAPSGAPSVAPSISTAPSDGPTGAPSAAPSTTPTGTPSATPSLAPSTTPSVSTVPSGVPSAAPSAAPSVSTIPSMSPSFTPQWDTITFDDFELSWGSFRRNGNGNNNHNALRRTDADSKKIPNGDSSLMLRARDDFFHREVHDVAKCSNLLLNFKLYAINMEVVDRLKVKLKGGPGKKDELIKLFKLGNGTHTTTQTDFNNKKNYDVTIDFNEDTDVNVADLEEAQIQFKLDASAKAEELYIDDIHFECYVEDAVQIGLWEDITRDNFEDGWGNFKNRNGLVKKDSLYIPQGEKAIEFSKKRDGGLKLKELRDVSSYENLRLVFSFSAHQVDDTVDSNDDGKDWLRVTYKCTKEDDEDCSKRLKQFDFLGGSSSYETNSLYKNVVFDFDKHFRKYDKGLAGIEFKAETDKGEAIFVDQVRFQGYKTRWVPADEL